MNPAPKHRKRLRRIESPGQARFITCSCWQRLPLFNNPRIRDAFAEQLALVRERGALRLLGWVIMPEHVHVLLIPSLPTWTMPQVLRALKQPFAKRVIDRWREVRAPILSQLEDWTGNIRFWQRGGGYDRNIVSDAERIEKLDYIHANPISRGLVANPIDWPWSSARAYARDDDILVPIDRVS